jgi:hypothetical protein
MNRLFLLIITLNLLSLTISAKTLSFTLYVDENLTPGDIRIKGEYEEFLMGGSRPVFSKKQKRSKPRNKKNTYSFSFKPVKPHAEIRSKITTNCNITKLTCKVNGCDPIEADITEFIRPAHMHASIMFEKNIELYVYLERGVLTFAALKEHSMHKELNLMGIKFHFHNNEAALRANTMQTCIEASSSDEEFALFEFDPPSDDEEHCDDLNFALFSQPEESQPSLSDSIIIQPELVSSIIITDESDSEEESQETLSACELLQQLKTLETLIDQHSHPTYDQSILWLDNPASSDEDTDIEDIPDMDELMEEEGIACHDAVPALVTPVDLMQSTTLFEGQLKIYRPSTQKAGEEGWVII